MPTLRGARDVKEEMVGAVSAARRKVLVAFAVLPVIFAAILAIICYVVTHWPYPPRFEWVSRWTPGQLFLPALGVIALYLLLCFILVWRLAARWLWAPTARALDIIEGRAEEEGAGSHAGGGDVKYVLYRIERALAGRLSGAESAREIESVRSAAERLCNEIERMSARDFSVDFSVEEGALEPLGKCLSDCCTELSGFLGGCTEVAGQIRETLLRAREKADALVSQAEQAFVGQGELYVGVKNFSKRVGEALDAAALESRGELTFDRRSSYEATEGFGRAVSECSGALDGFAECDDAGMGISKDSKSLADEATVIALNAAIEASRSGSSDLEALAECARKLAERSMDLGERVGSLTTGYIDAVRKASEALEDLKVRLQAWRGESSSLDAKRVESAAGIEGFLRSVRDMAASLAEQVESVARVSEGASSEGQAAKKAIDEAIEEMESLKRRLGGDGS